MVLTGSCTTRNSSVPVVVEGRSGVNRKWFRGETTTTSNLDLSRSCSEKRPIARIWHEDLDQLTRWCVKNLARQQGNYFGQTVSTPSASQYDDSRSSGSRDNRRWRRSWRPRRPPCYREFANAVCQHSTPIPWLNWTAQRTLTTSTNSLDFAVQNHTLRRRTQSITTTNLASQLFLSWLRLAGNKFSDIGQGGATKKRHSAWILPLDSSGEYWLLDQTARHEPILYIGRVGFIFLGFYLRS